MAKRLKAWDQYVADATAEPLELPLADGTCITITMPSFEQLEQIADAQQRGDNAAAVKALFGEETGSKIIALAKPQPAGALLLLVKDVMAGFNLDGAPGESSASPS